MNNNHFDAAEFVAKLVDGVLVYEELDTLELSLEEDDEEIFYSLA